VSRACRRIATAAVRQEQFRNVSPSQVLIVCRRIGVEPTAQATITAFFRTGRPWSTDSWQDVCAFSHFALRHDEALNGGARPLGPVAGTHFAHNASQPVQAAQHTLVSVATTCAQPYARAEAGASAYARSAADNRDKPIRACPGAAGAVSSRVSRLTWPSSRRLVVVVPRLSRVHTSFRRR
jgi:hypothetical protein